MFRTESASAHAGYFFDRGRVTRIVVQDTEPHAASHHDAAVRLVVEGGTTEVCLYLDPKDASRLLVSLEDWYSGWRAKIGKPIEGLVLDPQDAVLDGAEIESDYQRSDSEQV